MNKVYLKIAAVLLLAGLSARNGNAQDVGGGSPDRKMLSGSPTGASLESLNAPNLFTGSLNINIPIYQYSHDGQNYGISLSYDTRGVKVDEVEGTPGLHWNISSPSITRVVHGLPDEMNVKMDSLWDYLYPPYPDTLIPNREMYLKGRLATYQETPAELARTNAVQDEESDEFIVFLGNSQFSFYIGTDFQIFTNPHRNVKITMLLDGAPVTSVPETGLAVTAGIAFMITDEQGNRYYFEPDAREEIKLNYWDWDLLHEGGTPVFHTSVHWAIDKILFANGDSLTYTYESHSPAGYTYYLYDYFNYYVRENPPGTSSPSFMGIDAPNNHPSVSNISAIHYPNGVTASFTYGPKTNALTYPMLGEIKIASGDNCLRYRFYQNPVNGRQFLDTITTLSCDSSKEELYYSFEYNTSPSLPGRLNGAQDLFGYYNGDSTGTAVTYPENSGVGITIPRHHPDIGGAANYGNERAYSFTDAQAGLLIAVENAYGGKLEYDYSMEPVSGQLAGLPTDNYFIGTDAMDGVTLSSIYQTDKYHQSGNKITFFHYSGGQIFMPGGYFHYPEYIDSTTGDWSQLMFQSMFLTPHQLIQGANHGFSTVTTETYDGNSNLLSKREITFSNMKDATSNNQPRYYKVPGSKDYYEYPYTNKQYLKDWEIGLPLTITDYDQNDHIVQKTTNKYRFNNTPDLSAAAYISNTKTVKVNSGTRAEVYAGFGYYPYQKIFTDNYYPFTGWAPLDTTIIQKYVSDNRYISDTVVYVYDDHHNLKSTITQNSRGEKTDTRLVYNYDVDGPGTAFAQPGTTLYNMTDSGLEKVVASERWKPDASGSLAPYDDKLLTAYIAVYHFQDGKLWTQKLLNTDIGAPLTYEQYTGINMGSPYVSPFGKILTAYNTSNVDTGFRETSRVTLFDERGNPLESQFLGQDQFKATIWDTAIGQQLAQAANCRYSDIAYTSFETGLAESNLSVSGATPNTTSDPVTGIHVLQLWTPVSPGTATVISGTQNLQTGKEYTVSFWAKGAPPTLSIGSSNISLPDPIASKGSWNNYIVRFEGNGGKIHITGTAPLTFIDEIRLYPVGTQMQSRTYELLFGVSSTTDASGRITYYEYDQLGRQSVVRDQDGNILSKTEYHIGQ